jgi:prefoldin subunit 5
MSQQDQPDPEQIKAQMSEIDEQMTVLRQQIIQTEIRIGELQLQKQALARQLPFNDRFNQLFK